MQESPAQQTAPTRSPRRSPLLAMLVCFVSGVGIASSTPSLPSAYSSVSSPLTSVTPAPTASPSPHVWTTSSDPGHEHSVEPTPSALPEAVQGVGAPLGLPNLSAGTEVKTAEGAYSYEAVYTSNGDPVRWCAERGVSYRVRTQGMPPEGLQDLQEAMSTLTQISGIRFEYLGTTDEAPRPTGSSADSQPIEAGQQDAVLIAWSDEGEDSDLAGPVLGYSGPTVVSRGEQAMLSGGQVVLDRKDLGRLSQDAVKAVVLHELSHLLGLGHDDDSSSLMQERLSSPVITSLSPANRTALRSLGSGPCYW